MINDVEKEKRRIRWWFNIASSAVIICLGGALIVLRYFFNFNPMREKFWMFAGLLLGYGALRLSLYVWRGKHLYDDLEEE